MPNYHECVVKYVLHHAALCRVLACCMKQYLVLWLAKKYVALRTAKCTAKMRMSLRVQLSQSKSKSVALFL